MSDTSGTLEEIEGWEWTDERWSSGGENDEDPTDE